MKFSVLQQDLLPHLQAVSRSVGVRSQLPVLDNVLLSLQGKLLKIAATNLEVGVIKYIEVTEDTSGEITVPAKTLVELISGMGPRTVTLESEGDVLSIQSGKFKATINGIAPVEFPAIPQSTEKGVAFPKEAIMGASAILFAAAVDEGRPVLTGILTEAKAGQLDFVATDGFRLAHRVIKLAKGQPEFKSLIPRRTFEELLKIIGEEEVEEISVSTSPNQNQVVFSLGKTVVSSRLIEGQFPAWEKIIPTQIIAKALVEKEMVLKAIKLAAVFSRDGANIVVLSLKKGVLKFESHAKELGSQENEIEGEIEGEELQIAFNTKFLLDAVSSSPSMQIMIEFSGPFSACSIKPVGVEGLEYIVMPVRLS